jgi:hypothetical protein
MPPRADNASASDGIYNPITDREIYQKISSDYQEIVKLTNQVNEGNPLPSSEILEIYEEAKLAVVGAGRRIMRDFARDPARTREFPDAMAFYCSATFLDDPVIDAITGSGSAAGYTDAQRRQAIQKGLLRIIYHWSRHYIDRGGASLSPGLVDEGWAVYMGFPTAEGTYPNSLSAVAVSREGNFERQGSVDVPLREAMARAQKAAADKDPAAYEAAKRDIYSRYHAIFYLATARYINESARHAQDGNAANAGVAQIEGLSFYQSIQPTVAKADAAADETIVAYFKAPAGELTTAKRDEALAALNKAFDALLLKAEDRVTPETFN